MHWQSGAKPLVTIFMNDMEYQRTWVWIDAWVKQNSHVFDKWYGIFRLEPILTDACWKQKKLYLIFAGRVTESGKRGGAERPSEPQTPSHRCHVSDTTRHHRRGCVAFPNSGWVARPPNTPRWPCPSTPWPSHPLLTWPRDHKSSTAQDFLGPQVTPHH